MELALLCKTLLYVAIDDPLPDDVYIYHAGTRYNKQEQIVTAGESSACMYRVGKFQFRRSRFELCRTAAHIAGGAR